MSEATPLLVVGTGRCGSTLVSALVREHPEVLSVSELFSFCSDLGSLIPRVFDPGPVSGAGFWDVMATPMPRANLLLRHGLQMDEVIYPFDAGRYRRETGVPPLSMAMLPHLCDHPDRLLDELAEVMRERPPTSMAEHYRAMFDYLRERFGRRTWVERSGGSLRIIHRLIEAFPEARILHLVRDGRNTAISMSRHIGFRMALVGFSLLELLGVDPFEDDDRSEVGDLSDELAALLPEVFTKEAFEAYDLSPSLCGHYWSGEIRRGTEVLRSLPAERVTTLRYEDLIERPRQSVARLGDLLDLGPVDPDWVEAGAARIGRGRSVWQELSPVDKRELQDACAPGFAALAQLGVRWPETGV